MRFCSAGAKRNFTLIWSFVRYAINTKHYRHYEDGFPAGTVAEIIFENLFLDKME